MSKIQKKKKQIIKCITLLRIVKNNLLLNNLNQTVKQIHKAIKRINTYIWLRSGNSLRQREKSLRGSQTQEINY
jgi:hypothetical protein